MRQPNTFIIGAPKSGTTALASYLSAHPAAFVCNPKEPFFWAGGTGRAADFRVGTSRRGSWQCA